MEAPNKTFVQVLKGLHAQDPSGFRLDELLKKFRLGSVPKATEELIKATEYGLVSSEGNGRFAFEDCFSQYNPDNPEAVLTSPSVQETTTEEVEEDAELQPYTCVVTFASGDDTQSYALWHYWARHPKAAELMAVQDLEDNKRADSSCLFVLPGKLDALDSKSTLPVVAQDPGTIWIEVDDTSEVRDVYGINPPQFLSLSWAAVQEYDCMAELHRDDPYLYEQLNCFNEYCRENGWSHAAGVDTIDLLMAKPKLRFEQYLVLEAAGDTWGEAVPDDEVPVLGAAH